VVYCQRELEYSGGYYREMERYNLISTNIASLERKLSDNNLSDDEKRCYEFHLKKLKSKLEKIQQRITI